jgi:nucleoside-diphosphate-sugar epimerase
VADLTGAKILMTGTTGQVGFPLAVTLARANEVWAAARFSDPEAKGRHEEAGITTVAVDLAADDLAVLPNDFDYVLNFAVAHGGPKDFDRDLALNAEASGLLMTHARTAKAFLHCSSTAVYAPAGHQALEETDPLGDNHRVILPTYSLCKIAGEAVVRTAARQLGLPTTIARLNVPYGDNGGWPAFHLEMLLANQPVPVHTDAPSLYNPIHDDDIAAMVPALLDAASVPATIVNWGGNDAVSIEEWCAYLGELTGLDGATVQTDQTLESVTIDTTRMHELVGTTSVDWRDGFRRMVEARHPELLKS